MAERHPNRKRPPKSRQQSAGSKSRGVDPGGGLGSDSPGIAHEWTLRQSSPASGEAGSACWELVPPRTALERAEDLAEVHAMLAAGEVEIARDELLWLLEGCHEFLEAHRLLGELALADEDLPLARAHFGYAYRLGQRAIQRAGAPRAVPHRLPANQPFHESGKGLVWCLLQLEMPSVAAEVVEFLEACDPSDPLGVRKLLDAAERAADE